MPSGVALSPITAAASTSSSIATATYISIELGSQERRWCDNDTGGLREMVLPQACSTRCRAVVQMRGMSWHGRRSSAAS